MNNIITYLSSEETKNAIMHLIGENLSLYQGIDTEEKIQSLTGSLYNYFVLECVQNNQYVSLSNETIDAVNSIYRNLIKNLRGVAVSSSTSMDNLEIIVQNHRKRLIAALQHNTYTENQEQIFIPCSEYSGSFQSQLLRLDELVLKEPILDVGCGKKHQLLTFLQEKGHANLYGIDQYVSDDTRISCCNWFDYHFLPTTWGTIIAHMSFSNHFRRSLINQDATLTLYTEKYQEILNSLLPGGCFIYSPSVKTIEQTLDEASYSVTYFPNLEDRNLDTVCIQKKSR
ncbi:hypothetical protein [uncultured Sphaerochaeta sp.]|uniref:hypothetical protein n=1 Tax=uncultured Sphaerochaeta sp. TaxID=886478 RepID=UPI002A0A15ED|nr:hypothetical protein [uncultured Sphaerochaeta sp.]